MLLSPTHLYPLPYNPTPHPIPTPNPPPPGLGLRLPLPPNPILLVPPARLHTRAPPPPPHHPDHLGGDGGQASGVCGVYAVDWGDRVGIRAGPDAGGELGRQAGEVGEGSGCVRVQG